ncbi:MAG: sulfite exporter TauE/SafE family protein [Fimbriimonadaceae bacterium]|nr:MAG: sulfite exporter TauE/SafE family protein [Fimbriimonadaceae bacterium]
MIEVFGWAGVFAVGFVLGLLGGGGSILIVPVLVYLFGQTAQQSTGLSLFVVGLSSAIGLILSKEYKQVHWSSVIAFAIPSSIGAFLARQFLVPLTPDPILGISKDMFLLIAFALLMLIVGVKMILPSANATESEEKKN